MFGRNMDPLDLFKRGLPFEGPIDVRWFENIPNESVARMALEFLSIQANEIELRKRHTQADIERMWRAVFRGCLAHGVLIPNGLLGYARRLGIVIPS